MGIDAGIQRVNYSAGQAIEGKSPPGHWTAPTFRLCGPLVGMVRPFILENIAA